MKNIAQKCKYIITAILFSGSFFAMSSDLPDPEVLAKQYLKDLCTLNEQDFTRKYMLTQLDAVDFIKNLTKAYKDANDETDEEISDSLAIRSEVHSFVVKSYRVFKEWQHENNIDSSKIKYHSYEFKLEKRRKIPYYSLDEINIYFSYDTLNYLISCADFLYLKTKWVAGNFDGIYKVDKYFNTIYEDYDYGVDTVAIVEEYSYDHSYEGDYSEVDNLQPVTKKQLKIQKKIDAYNRKIDALYIKQYE